MVTDFFSHKIHSGNDEWGYKLIDIATIFAEFDGKPYNRKEIEERFKEISPRALTVGRDSSKFRDEISVYHSYLGLYHLEWNTGNWILKISETAKRFLVIEEPNVAAFMILQLLYFQYPNGKGVQKYLKSGKVNLQANSRNKTLEYIEDRIHVSPFRLICKALKADSTINGINSLHPRVTVDEIFALANDVRTNQLTSPGLNDVVTVLSEIRTGLVVPPKETEKRFHVLNHTDFLQVTNGVIHLREYVSQEEQDSLIKKLDAINSIGTQFDGFDSVETASDLSSVIAGGEWGNYFDGVRQLTAELVQSITDEEITNASTNTIQEGDDLIPDNSALKFKYPLKERGDSFVVNTPSSRAGIVADPEVTRIKRQRSNLQHKILVQKLDEYIRKRGGIPKESEHIDLFAKIPEDGSFLFEVKSISNENLLSQTRKALSQLYEYRYRYNDEIEADVVLCLVYPYEPSEISWLQKYLCLDRNIAVCWFDQENLRYPSFCYEQLKSLLIENSKNQ